MKDALCVQLLDRSPQINPQFLHLSFRGSFPWSPDFKGLRLYEFVEIVKYFSQTANYICPNCQVKEDIDPFSRFELSRKLSTFCRIKSRRGHPNSDLCNELSKNDVGRSGSHKFMIKVEKCGDLLSFKVSHKSLGRTSASRCAKWFLLKKSLKGK